MYPWLWIFAPQIYFPWSGSVEQQIEPDISWFFNAIPAQAGNGRIEKKAFEIASYGKQLGLITEVLIAAAEKAGPLSGEAAASLARLKSIHTEIENMKAADTESLIGEVEAAFARLRSSSKPEFALVRERLRLLLAETSAT